jgi:uncharacterized protein (TIGR03435 family)
LGKNVRHAAIAVVLVCCAVAAGLAFPQTSSLQPLTSSASPSFEVATIKPNTADSNRVNLNLQPGGRFVATNVSLQVLISVAYGDPLPLPPNRIAMNAKWIGGTQGAGYATADRFDVEAKADRDLAQNELQLPLRTLLADRFKLVVHHETKELPAYSLLLDRADGRLGPRMKRSDVDCSDPREFTAKNADGTSKCGFRSVPGSAKGRATVANLARFLTNPTADHRPVENRTGLEGTFDFDLTWTPEVPVPADAPPGPAVDPNGPSLFTALREQLGLKLEPAKSRIDILVVDRAERPSAN